MTRILGLTFGGLLLSASLSFAGDLTVRDIMELHRSGLGEEVLIALIETDGGPFTLDLVDIQELKAVTEAFVGKAIPPRAGGEPYVKER